MEKLLLTQGVYVARIIAAGLCGVLIGYERQNRLKVVGIRTHFVIAMAAALMMIVSKYGFNDALISSRTSVDVSRVASGILAGVGIMGGGLVITGKGGFTSGLTTAAGIWATVGIGMAFGAGMYIIGVCGTVILIIGQVIMHRNIKLAKHIWRGQMDFLLHSDVHDIEEISNNLKAIGIDVLRVKYDLKDSESEKIRIFFAISTCKDREAIADIIAGIPDVCSYEF